MQAGIPKIGACDADSSRRNPQYQREDFEGKEQKENAKKVNQIAFDRFSLLLFGTLYRNFSFLPSKPPAIMFRRFFKDLVEKRLYHS
jgi:hypothetical protein